MLLEVPNPKDPQDAEVAKMLIENPPLFARTANTWAVQYAGATPQDAEYSQYSPAPEKAAGDDLARCVYNYDRGGKGRPVHDKTWGNACLALPCLPECRLEKKNLTASPDHLAYWAHV